VLYKADLADDALWAHFVTGMRLKPRQSKPRPHHTLGDVPVQFWWPTLLAANPAKRLAGDYGLMPRNDVHPRLRRIQTEQVDDVVGPVVVQNGRTESRLTSPFGQQGLDFEHGQDWAGLIARVVAYLSRAQAPR